MNSANQRVLMRNISCDFVFNDTVMREISNHAITHKKGKRIHDKYYEEK